MDTSRFKKLVICRAVTVPFFFQNHLRSTIEFTHRCGHTLILAATDGPELDLFRRMVPPCIVRPIEIVREISPLRDLLSVMRMVRILRAEKVDVLHTCTPKAGLVGALAGFIARVPVRMHTFTGQAWALRGSVVKLIGKLCDRLIIVLNTQCYADSDSQVAFMVENGVCSRGKLKVIGAGSLAGVNTSRFSRTNYDATKCHGLRAALKIPLDAKVINFTGRINRDKGIAELLDAFESLCLSRNDCFLVIAGPYDEGPGAISAADKARIEAHPKIRSVGYVADPAAYYAMADILCLPSYREGFGNVIIEAASLGVPVVATRISGVVDAVVENKTGLLVEPKNREQLKAALERLLNDDALRAKLGTTAMERARNLFDQETINNAIVQEYYLGANRVN